MNIEATMDNATTSTKPWKKYAPKNGRLTVRNAVEKFMISRMNCTAKTRENYWASLNLLVSVTVAQPGARSFLEQKN